MSKLGGDKQKQPERKQVCLSSCTGMSDARGEAKTEQRLKQGHRKPAPKVWASAQDVPATGGGVGRRGF